jgi:hypothetical protein
LWVAMLNWRKMTYFLDSLYQPPKWGFLSRDSFWDSLGQYPPTKGCDVRPCKKRIWVVVRLDFERCTWHLIVECSEAS